MYPEDDEGTEEGGFMVMVLPPPVTFNLRFPGQYYDTENKLFYNLNRYYNPELGRYMEPDPIGLEGGLNVYNYAGANPVMYTDPSGLCPMCVGAIFGGLGYGVPLLYGAITSEEGFTEYLGNNFDGWALTTSMAVGAVTGGVSSRILASNGITINYGKTLFKDIGPYRYHPVLKKAPIWGQNIISNSLRTWTNPGGATVKLAAIGTGMAANTTYEKVSNNNSSDKNIKIPTNNDSNSINSLNQDLIKLNQQQLREYNNMYNRSGMATVIYDRGPLQVTPY